jgi:hypothetical protein
MIVFRIEILPNELKWNELNIYAFLHFFTGIDILEKNLLHFAIINTNNSLKDEILFSNNAIHVIPNRLEWNMRPKVCK